jgi:NAD(P)-dependent dehydrogenase (short-subunit alcohol dehydrogenase family)
MPTLQKSAVITGASSGIGRSCVERMSRAGWQVFAGVRREADRENLRREFAANVWPVLMNVENEASIAAGAADIERQLSGRGLDGLVNVAGIGMLRPVEYATMQDLRKIFDVNFFGQVAIIQAFLRLLRKKCGRIVNITTVGVNIAIPFGGLLNASKSAFAKLSDTLRLEMRSFGVRVIAIEPGSISTPAVDKTLGDLEKVILSLPAEAQALYGASIRKIGRRGYAMEKNGSSSDVVAAAVHHALTSSRPRIRYRVGKHAKLAATLPKILPERLMDAILHRMLGSSDGPETGRKESQTQRAARPVSPRLNPK